MLTLLTASIAVALAGTAAAAAYLDAKHHIREDLSKSSLDAAAKEVQEYIVERTIQNRLLGYHNVEAWAKEDRPNHLFLEFEGRSWTYKQFYQDVQRVGNWLMNDLGIQKGEMVALNGPNTAEYMLLWYALDAIGACESFINHNLTGGSLTHCVKLSKCRILLAERETEGRVEPSREELETEGARVVYYDDQLLSSTTNTTPIPKSRTTGMLPTDLRSLIYTSGTTVC